MTETIEDRLQCVRARIKEACERCGRDPVEIELVAVSKTRPADDVRRALAAGQEIFGENRVQELVAKSAELQHDAPRWHMIGSLQTNKVKALLSVPRLDLLHSLDSIKLADALQQHLEKGQLEQGRGELDVLLEVHATDEPAKHGCPLAETEELMRHVLQSCPRLRLRGLMAMGPRTGDPAQTFATVAALRLDLEQRTGRALPVSSLGMTADLEAAIEAGSTMVRIGTAIFGSRPR